ncbi:MAG TPA: tail fiber domain-containing protein [Fluviicoccus sp.]|nr:tail fiber domain-containing protein [Fluviicoccus sp.]
MGVKLSNNAATILAATIGISDTSITVAPGTGALFPSLSAGDWFPATIVKSNGDLEIVKVTARAGDVFTVERAQDSTPARTFNPGDRVDLRLTAGALSAILAEKLDKTGGTLAGDMTVTGALSAGSLSTPSASITTLNGGTPWTTANFAPGGKADLSGATFSGAIAAPALTISSTAPIINMGDTDWGTRYIHANGGLLGFLTSGGGWAFYTDNAGNTVATGNVSAYSDIRLKEDIEQLAGALGMVQAIRGVKYRRKDSGERQVGVIAQEVQAVLPELVQVNQGGVLSVAYGNMAGLLVEAVKELAERVEALEGRA